MPVDDIVGSLWGYVWGPEARRRRLGRRLQQAQAVAKGYPVNWRMYFGYIAGQQIVDRVIAAGTTDTAAIVKAFEGYKYEGYKQQTSFYRACDHQSRPANVCRYDRAEEQAPQPRRVLRRSLRRSAGNSRPNHARTPTAPRRRRSSTRKRSRPAPTTRRSKCKRQFESKGAAHGGPLISVTPSPHGPPTPATTRQSRSRAS